MKKKNIAIVCSLVLIFAMMIGITACAATDASAATVDGYTVNGTITFSGADVDIQGNGIKIQDDGDVCIEATGVYLITGTSTEGRVIVKAEETDDVTLILSDLDLTFVEDETIYIKTAASATIVLADGTQNVITSGTAPATTDDDDEEDEDASGAAIRAKCPLTITGDGSLTVYGYINNGIAAKGSLTLESQDVTVTAVNNAMKSKTITVSVADIAE